MSQRVLDRIQEMKNEIIEFTKELISIPTIVPMGDKYREIAALISQKMNEIGFETEIIEPPDETMNKIKTYIHKTTGKKMETLPPRANVIGYLKGIVGKPSLHVNSHFSMLPLDHYTREAWSFSPYRAFVENDRLYGKGSSDIKGGISGMIFAVEAIRREGLRFKGDLHFSITCDAHLGGPGGAKYIVDKDYGKADMVIQVDVGYGTNVLAVGCNGILWLKIITYGKRAHGSSSNEGVNAVEKMNDVMRALQELKGKKKVRSSWPIKPDSGRRPNMTIGTTIKGGDKIQLVPDYCEMTIDRRIIPEETVEGVKDEILAKLEQLKEKDPELDYAIETVYSAEPAVEKPDSRIATVMLKNIEKVTGLPPEIAVKGGFKENRFFQQGWETPTMSYSGGRYEYLKKDEHIPIKDLIDASKVLALTYMDILGIEQLQK